jgi:hypothetical protein
MEIIANGQVHHLLTEQKEDHAQIYLSFFTRGADSTTAVQLLTELSRHLCEVKHKHFYFHLAKTSGSFWKFLRGVTDK